MANTYTQTSIHAVFAVKGRQNILSDKFRENLFRYITGILNNNGHYSLAVNGYKDHVHIFSNSIQLKHYQTPYKL